jgi:hypothetical protein
VHSACAAKTSSSQTKNGNGQNPEDAGNFVLTVQRPRLTRAPEPPLEIAAWLEDGWDDPGNDFTVKQT